MVWCICALCLLAWPIAAQESSEIETLLLRTDAHLIATELLLQRSGSSLDAIDSIWTERELSLQQTEQRLDERESFLAQRENSLQSRETRLLEQDSRLQQREQAIEKRSSSIDEREARIGRLEWVLKATPWVALALAGGGYLAGGLAR